MNKSQVIPAVQKRLQETTGKGFRQEGVKAVLTAFFEIVQEEVEQGNQIMWTGFGHFERYERKARKAANPKTGEPMEVKARKAIKFTPAKQFKNRVEEFVS